MKSAMELSQQLKAIDLDILSSPEFINKELLPRKDHRSESASEEIGEEMDVESMIM